MSDSYVQDALEGIAIIGMSGRFPKAKNIDEFWKNLKEGVEAISFFSKEDARACGASEEDVNDPNYVFAGGVLEDIEMFDSAFFGINPREAENMDPQQRLFLECAYEALENAGYAQEQYDYPIGVYAGSNMSTYFLYHLINKVGMRDDFGLAITNDKDYLATRLSYQFNLKGPSISVQTACSTSATAIAMACEGLLNYHCDMALAGGVAVKLPQKLGYLYQEGMIMSPDGYVRPFDAKAQGTVFTNAVGIVVLKRLEDAINDGDHIYAVIKGIAVNNDGATKVGFTAPSREGQAEVIAAAQNLAGVSPEDLSYIETFGAGTQLGDPIEVSALNQVFEQATKEKHFCAIGSVKGNIGHTMSAAGVTATIKTALALKYKQIPPSINFETPNSKIDFDNSAFYVNTKLIDWISDKPRLAGVNSYGFGGTNVHAVLGEAPVTESSSSSRQWQMLTLSAKTACALEKMAVDLAEYFKENREVNLADVAYTLHVGRREFEHRKMVLCRDVEEAIRLLESGEDVLNGIATEILEETLPELDPMINECIMLKALGQVWIKGGKIDWVKFHESEKRLRVPLPTYPFERKRHWVEQFNITEYVKNGKQTASEIHSRPDISTPYVPASNATEEAIAGIWQKLLGVQPVGINDDFFDLGGHSLLATNMISELAKRFHMTFSMQSLFENSTVAKMAKLVDGELESEEGYEEGAL